MSKLDLPASAVAGVAGGVVGISCCVPRSSSTSLVSRPRRKRSRARWWSASGPMPSCMPSRPGLHRRLRRPDNADDWAATLVRHRPDGSLSLRTTWPTPSPSRRGAGNSWGRRPAACRGRAFTRMRTSTDEAAPAHAAARDRGPRAAGIFGSALLLMLVLDVLVELGCRLELGPTRWAANGGRRLRPGPLVLHPRSPPLSSCYAAMHP